MSFSFRVAETNPLLVWLVPPLFHPGIAISTLIVLMEELIMYLPREEGQGLVEYALILVLVAVVVIAILAVLGPQIGNVFSQINNAL
jgi:pilus assembly protein Flp/PilA